MRNVATHPIIVEVAKLSFSYGDEKVLKNISLAVHKGDYLGIIGPNGAGKTTLLKIMLGLLKPTHGIVQLFGKDIGSFHEWSRIGYVPQKVTNFDLRFPATVREIVLMGRYARRGLMHRVTHHDRALAKKALEQVDMWEYRDRLIGDLSGGQQQRVFIARALAGEPEIIFLDEPTTSVDKETHDQFYALLRKLNATLGLTLILVSHDVDTVAAEASKIAEIDRVLLGYTLPVEYLMKHHHHLPHHHVEHHA